jgi:hypothetical protein
MFDEIPLPIRRAIESGEAILFLGAGASFDAMLKGVKTRITGDELRDRLSNEFLGGQHKKKPLMAVADYARNEASLGKVQTFVHSVFYDLAPADFHMLVPKFRWRAIVTTNYDLVVERAYENSPDALQSLAPVTMDGEELEKALAGQNTVPYLKLHGCIKNYADVKTPIVLDSYEYAKFKAGRENIVRAFKEWAIQSPIIFCGYSLNDENIKDILFDIGDASQSRDTYLYVDLEFDDIQRRYWAARRIVPVAGTYAKFLDAVDAGISSNNRQLASLFKMSDLSIAKWIPSHNSPSDNLVQYLNEELLHILPDPPPSVSVDPKSFYSGLDTSFSPIYMDLDVHRGIGERVLNRAVIDTLESTQPKLFFITGYAGCGKSVLAKRSAFETSKLLDLPLVVWLKEGAVLRPELILELQELVQSRLYLFIDDALDHEETLPSFVEKIFQKSSKISIVACARTNEINIYGQAMRKRVNDTFELHDLAEKEVLALLKKLSASKVLGPLEQYSEDERKTFVQKFYEQQLLVALHEITFADSFEQILVSEFEKILPREAQQLYLDICTLHQSGVGVRAGLLSRISGLPITALNEYLDGPLARVVRIHFESRFRDYVYKSRHSEISKMVFSLVIRDQEQRARQLTRILSMIDLDYSSDKKAFFDLVKGRRLAEIFDKKEFALQVFDAAEEANGPPAFLLHQRAILEIAHQSGNLDVAAECLRLAEIENQSTGYRDTSIQHTRANLFRRKALSSSSEVERDRYRADARAILKSQVNRTSTSYPEHLLGQVLLDELKETFTFSQEDEGNTKDVTDLKEQAVIRITSELSQLIDGQLRKEPNDASMTVLRSEFLKVMGQQPQALTVLERFYTKTPDNSVITRIYGEALSSVDQIDRGIEVLKQAVLASPADKMASLSLAKLLIKKDEFGNASGILSSLRRSFSDGDSHYEARLLYARCSLLYGDLERGHTEFRLLRDVFIENKDKVSFRVKNLDGVSRRYSGNVVTKQAAFGFLRSSELRFNVHFNKSKSGLKAGIWEAVTKGAVFDFTLAFTYRGPIATDLVLKI